MEVPNYRKLVVWQKAHHSAIALISIVKGFEYRFPRLVDQSLAAATSIGANIAEGNAVTSRKQKESYFQIALNSSYELDNWIQVFKDAPGINLKEDVLREIEKENLEVIKILSTIIRNLSS